MADLILEWLSEHVLPWLLIGLIVASVVLVCFLVVVGYMNYGTDRAVGVRFNDRGCYVTRVVGKMVSVRYLDPFACDTIREAVR